MKKLFRSILVLLSVVVLSLGMTGVLAACSDGEGTEPPATETTYTVTIEPSEHGTVLADKESYKGGDSVTLSIKAEGGYELTSILVDGTEKLSSVADNQLKVTINANMTVRATFGEIGPMDTTVSVASSVNLRGMTLTLKTDGAQDITVTVSDENTFELSDVAYGTKYEVFGKASGVEVALGEFTVRSEATEYNPSSQFTSEAVDMDFTTGSYEYKYNAQLGEYVFTDIGENIAEGDAYVAAKISIPEEAMDTLLTTGEAAFGISMTVGGETAWVNIWLKGADLENGGQFMLLANMWTEASVSFLKGGKLTEYGEALVGDGFWLVLKYENETGYLHNYVGTSAEDMKYVRSWGLTESGGFDLPANGKLTAFGVGKQSTWGNDVSFDVNFSNVRYGATLGEALGLTQDVTLTSDSAYEHGSVAVSGKPYGDVALTFTPDTDYALASVKVNGESKDFDGNTIVLEDYAGTTVKVEAVFELITELESVDVTIPSNVSMNGMELTLTKGGTDTVTATVSEGKFTLQNVTIGDEYAVTAEVNGIKTDLGTIRIARNNNVFDPSLKVGAGNGGTLDFVNGTYSYKKGDPAGTDNGFAFTPAETVSGDMWFAMKISIPELADLNTPGDQVICGFNLTIGDTTRCIGIRYFNDGSNITYLALSGDWTEALSETYVNALKGDGLWFVVYYNSSNGMAETWLGTTPDDITKLRDWGGEGGRGFAAGQDLVSYSVGFYHDWNKDKIVDVTFSNVGFGATLDEALGKTAE